MTITIDDLDKVLEETYNRMFGDLMKITEEVQHERDEESRRRWKDVKAESKDKK